MEEINIHKKIRFDNIKEKEADRLYREIGLGKKEDRKKYNDFASNNHLNIDYEISFSNNTKAKNHG